jgi:hypothetical protein
MAWTTIFMDGADHYATADLSAKYDTLGSSVSVDATIFRNSGKSIKGSSGSGSYLNKRVGEARNFCVGFGLYLTGSPGAATIASQSSILLGVSNSPSGQALGQVGLGLLNDGLIHAIRGPLNISNNFSGVADLGASTTAISTNNWYFIELRGFVDNTDGQLELRINGVVQFNLTSQDTQHQTFNNFSYLSLAAPAGSTYFDDIYMRTSNQATAETGGFLGDIKVKPYYPNGDGTYSAMTPSTGTDHYALVDESVPTTTDYVSSNTALQKDSYTFQDVSETGSIKAVQLNVYATKDDAGFRGLDLFSKSGATEDFAASQPLSTTPLYKTKAWDTDPNTAADWSQSNLNAAEFGQRISADL